jgi:uncharacterized protein GlcG (DUF336 family)
MVLRTAVGLLRWIAGRHTTLRRDSYPVVRLEALESRAMLSLASPAAALSASDVQSILAHATATARALGVNATIAVTDREGNALGVVRMQDSTFAPAVTLVDIDAGGAGGLEFIDGQVSDTFDVPTSLVALSKAGTAALLSTSQGNAFSTRTAAFIIQQNFPPGTKKQASGPLFGVQLSNLPTSDVSRLPLGLSGDPGGLPLYRRNPVTKKFELLGGIGVEVDGVYTAPIAKGRLKVTIEERVALGGQSGFSPPAKIRASNILVGGIRLPYAAGNAPKLSRFVSSPSFAQLQTSSVIDVLVTPSVSPASRFTSVSFAGVSGSRTYSITGEVPDNIDADFYDNGSSSLSFATGDTSSGQGLSSADVATILEQSMGLNHRLRAAIRRDSPQRSQVSVSVVDLNGNLLGTLRTADAPMFGFDVSVQKARTAALLSRPDAASLISSLDASVKAQLDTLDTSLFGLVFNGQATPFGSAVTAMQSLGIEFDGSVALSTRAIGFLARPDLPDGLNNTPAGPLSVRSSDVFSPFNTGLQTALMLTNLGLFLSDFETVGDEKIALQQLQDRNTDASTTGTLGGQGATSLAGKLLANGMQIFAGGVPLYKNGVLVGAIGVSGDGVEQDDYVALAGAAGFQAFGSGVKRADEVTIDAGGTFRLPYVKLPRSPFAGV